MTIEVLQLRKVFQDPRLMVGSCHWGCSIELGNETLNRWNLERLKNGGSFWELRPWTWRTWPLNIWGKDDNLNHWMEWCRLFCEHTHMRLSWFLSRNGISIPAKLLISRWRYLRGIPGHKSTVWSRGGWKRTTLEIHPAKSADLVSKMGSLV